MSNQDYNDVSLEVILKRIAPWFGILLAVISIYFSYDGLDQTVTGGNPQYTEIANYIGWIMAVSVTLIQFIFNSDFTRLSATLKVVGIVSYIYSLYTNYLGLEHLFGFHGIAGVAISIFMDVTPEAIIAWALEEETQGDMLGNIGKWVTGGGRRKFGKNKQPQQKHQYTFTPEQDTQPRMKTPQQQNQRKGKGRAYWEDESERQQGQSREKPARFGMFEE